MTCPNLAVRLPSSTLSLCEIVCRPSFSLTCHRFEELSRWTTFFEPFSLIACQLQYPMSCVPWTNLLWSNSPLWQTGCSSHLSPRPNLRRSQRLQKQRCRASRGRKRGRGTQRNELRFVSITSVLEIVLVAVSSHARGRETSRSGASSGGGASRLI